MSETEAAKINRRKLREFLDYLDLSNEDLFAILQELFRERISKHEEERFLDLLKAASPPRFTYDTVIVDKNFNDTLRCDIKILRSDVTHICKNNEGLTKKQLQHQADQAIYCLIREMKELGWLL